MSVASYLTFLFISALPMALTQSAGAGKVYIGTNENDTSPEQVYSFNMNFGESAFVMPLYLILYNETTGEPIEDYTSDVLVTCELDPVNDIGYSNVSFSFVPVFVPVPPFSGPIYRNISFSQPIPGRPTVVRCWGVSANQTDPQFTKKGSVSLNYAFEIRPPGVVNIFNSLVEIPNKPSTTPVSGSFLLQLSEIPLAANVSVDCFMNTTGLTVVILPKLVMVGEQRFQMTYNLTAKGNPVLVFCVAESINPGNYSQFDNSSSIGTTSIFMIAEGLASLYPEATSLKTTTMNAYLVLNEVPVTETTFYCTIQTVNSTAQANEIDLTCIDPDYVISPTAAPIPLVTTATDLSNQTGTNPFQTTSNPTTTGSTTVGSITTPARTGTGGTGTTPSTVTPSPTTQSNDTNQWVLVNNVYTFLPGAPLFQTVTIQRVYPVEVFTEELLVTKCCAPETMNTASPQFLNVTATMVTATYNTPPVAINWTAATTDENLQTETPIPNPGYVNVAPCPCNLQQGSCSADCCCDPDCSQSDIETFQCILGPEGGFPAATPRTDCNETYPNQDDWFPILCVQFDNTGFLGYYFFNQALIRSQSNLNTATSTYAGNFSFVRTQNIFPSSSQQSTYYRHGDSVKTGTPKDSVTEDFYIGSNYRLTLPSRTWTGKCVWTSPVQYLKDDYQTCVYQMQQDLCSDYTPLNALMYAQSSLWSGKTGAVVLEGAQSQVVAETNVNYLCADSNSQYTSKYIKSTDTVNDIMPPDQVFLFPYQLPVNEEGDTDCNFDSATGVYVCVNQSQDTQKAPVPVPPRCDFDDGFTRPPLPSYDNDTQTCSNAVLDVFYNFTWSGTDILYLNATIVLGSIPLEVSKTENITVTYTEISEVNNQTIKETKTNTTEVTTTYRAEFMQIFQTLFSSYGQDITNSTTVENITQSGSAKELRSGNPGYEYDLPVISGTAVVNESDGDFMYMDANSSQRLSLWDPSNTGLCYNADTKVAPFGQNSLTSCILRLSLTQLEDCENLRKIVLNRQDSLMPSSYVSIGGNPSYVNNDSWIQVFRQDVSSTINVTLIPTTTEQPFVTGTGETTVNVATTTAQQTTNNLFDNSSGNSSYYPYLQGVKGQCPNVASGIIATIMYAEVGLSNFHPIYQIVGAQINYTLSTWQMYCSGNLAGACYGNDSAFNPDGSKKIQPFVLSTAVNFIKVPAEAPIPMTGYQQRTYVPPTVCKYDSCWRELFYPWTKFNIGGYETYSIVIGLAFLIYGIGLVLILRPISRLG